ncbi:MAG: hypothetical protein IPK02_06865 [Candidatus Accumulibacter sp.]|uniref:Helicase ATP-binding domain-containing protein n=1 Tax=Candidatus Accumulibacter affinis TaxID=2954384 RepID=A0A935W434_9PROT|nr:hypothetical protein [Candidatus Accumulibacter affinis]
MLEHHAAQRLSEWFEERWNRWAIDVSQDLAAIIASSWAREASIPPYQIYLNIAYHLSTEARAGLSQFRLPGRFDKELFDFQKSAVKIAARHLHRRCGVMIGDVVGLGKTMMATALARMFEDDLGYETLIICPKNLEPMWERYRTEYGLRGMVVPISQVSRKLPGLKRYRLVLIDESHNLRNREGRRYKAIADYIRSCDARLSCSPLLPTTDPRPTCRASYGLFIDKGQDRHSTRAAPAQTWHQRTGVRAPAPVQGQPDSSPSKRAKRVRDWRGVDPACTWFDAHAASSSSTTLRKMTTARRYIAGNDGE